MAEHKKGFILYTDMQSIFKKLPLEKAGELINHIFSYVNDENPQADDLLIEIAFESIKQQLKRDLKKWEKLKQNKSDAGILGNLKRWHPELYEQYEKGDLNLKELQELANNRNESQSDTEIAVNVNVNVNVIKEIIDYLNIKTKKNYRYTTSKTQRLINARIKEGFLIHDFKKVIDNKITDWLEDEKMSEYLRPETLFGTKFESYLNIKQKVKKQSSSTDLLEEAVKRTQKRFNEQG